MNEQLLANLLAEFTGMFFRGNKENYDSAVAHKDKLYFATDTHELLVNGVSYGGGGITEVTLEGTTLTISLSDGSEKTVDLASLLKFTTQLPDDLATPTKIGGLNKGTTVETLKTKTLSQIFEDILFEEIQPTVQNPSCSISPKGSWANNGIYEVGAAAPSSESDFNISFNRGNCTVVGQPTKYRAGTETGRDVKLGSSALAAGAKITLGTMTYNLTINHGEGDTLLTSKGNKATVSPNPLTAGSVKASCNIYGTYPYFCNGASGRIDDVAETVFPSSPAPGTKLPLKKWTDTLIGAKFASEASTSVHLEFEFPSTKKITLVQFFDGTAKEWKTFASSFYTISDAGNKEIQGVQVPYKKLTTVGDLLGAMQMRFTVADAAPMMFAAPAIEDTPTVLAAGNRTEGVSTYPANFEPTGQVPLDARLLLKTKADLIAADTYSAKNYYKGMTVTVLDDGGNPAIYVLKDVAKITSPDYSGWQRMDASSAVSEKEVYKLPGDILSLPGISSSSEITSILGNVENVKNAITNKKVITALSDNIVLTVTAIDNTTDITFIVYTGITIWHISAKYSGSTWSEAEVTASQTNIPDTNDVVKEVRPAVDKGIEIGGSKNSPTVGIKIDTTTKGNVDLSVGANGLKATFTETTKGVKAGDKVLKVESDKTISSTISLYYDTSGKKIQLLGIGSEVIAEIDATAFIKDGMINAVELVSDPEDQDPGTYIKITFNTDAGKEPIFLNVTSLIDIYVQGNGISISGKTISVKLDTAGNSEGYLKLTAAGLKVDGVNSAISEAITTAFSWHEA